MLLNKFSKGWVALVKSLCQSTPKANGVQCKVGAYLDALPHFPISDSVEGGLSRGTDAEERARCILLEHCRNNLDAGVSRRSDALKCRSASHGTPLVNHGRLRQHIMQASKLGTSQQRVGCTNC